MIAFVNAKINIGLHITRRRPDGYHDLETVFYPVGLHNGSPENPEPFCDIIEITPAEIDSISLSGREIKCPPEKNLVWKALMTMRREHPELPPVNITLEKHIPDGAGLGGGSADASFTLRGLNTLLSIPHEAKSLQKLALTLGADCPVFIDNLPAYGTGVGERLSPLPELLRGYWLAIVKPPVYISTKEAFSGITPRAGRVNLEEAVRRPIEDWREQIHNDFEDSLFPKYPILESIRDSLYAMGALYASMSGSGSSLYGIFPTREAALQASLNYDDTDCFHTICML